MGLMFSIYNQLGYGLSEKIYQDAFEDLLITSQLPFEREKYVAMKLNDRPIAKLFMDFVVDNKIVIELKVRPTVGYLNIRQVTDYLKATNYQLAIIVHFTRDGIKSRRGLNPSNC